MAQAYLSNRVVTPRGTVPAAVVVEAGKIVAVCPKDALAELANPIDQTIDFGGMAILPGLVEKSLARGWRDRLGVLFRAPSWAPAGAPAAMAVAAPVDAPLTRAQAGTAIALFLLSTACTGGLLWRESETIPGIGHSVVAGVLVHGFYLGGTAIAIAHSIPAGLSALIPGLQPILTSTLANR